MRCPYCDAPNTSVVDSRSSEAGASVRRRRGCQKCERRFTTYERMEQTSRLMVIKKDGTHVPFESERILRGIQAACGKRPVDEDRKLAIVRDVEDAIHREYEREIESAEIGRRVARHLRDIDQVAWVRYTSEYLSFQTLDDVEEAISEIRNARPPVEGQSSLFPEQ